MSEFHKTFLARNLNIKDIIIHDITYEL